MKQPLESVPFDPEDVPAWGVQYEGRDFPPFGYAADVIGLAYDQEAGELHALLVERKHPPYAGHVAWPGGFVDWSADATAEDAALRELAEETGWRDEPSYQEALRIYDRNGRDPRQFAGHEEDGVWVGTGSRVISNAQLVLLRKNGQALKPHPDEDAARAFWANVYDYLPWEDVRSGTGRRARTHLVREVRAWAATLDGPRRRATLELRIDHAFGTEGEFNEERVSERLELLMEAGLLSETRRDVWGRTPRDDTALPSRTYGKPMAFDHRSMLADSLARLRGKFKYRPSLLAALLPDAFTFGTFKEALEAIGGRPVHRSNMQRIVTQTERYRILEATGQQETPDGGGRPARVYRFPADVDLVRLDPAIKIPWLS